MKKILLILVLSLTTFTGCTGSTGGNKNDVGITQSDHTSTLSVKQNEPADQAPEKEYIKPEMKGEITISILDEMEILTVGAEMFMKKYPDVKVTVNNFRVVEPVELANGSVMSGTPSEEFSTENYLSQLNTKIMTGKAEDIILTSGIPIRKYTDMGAFEDLSFFFNHSPEINSEDYFMNVFDAMKNKNNQLFELPLASNVQIVSFNKTLASENENKIDTNMKTISYEKALDYAKLLVEGSKKENTFLAIGSGAQVVYSILNDRFKEFIDVDAKKANFDTEQYISLLNMAKELEDKGYFDLSNIDFYNMEYYIALDQDFDMQAAYYSFIPDSIRYNSVPLSDAYGNVLVNPYYSFGINSASKNKELAWEFLKFMLSDEVQSSPSFYSMGVNKKGLDACVDRNLKMYNDGNKENINKQEYKNLLESWIMQINSYDSSRWTLLNMVYEENRDFFDDKKSAEETAKITQSKLDKYLNE